MEAGRLLGQVFPATGGREAPFVAISGASRLRWILPAKESKVARLLGTWRPYGLGSGLGWGLIRAAAWGGFLDHLPDVEVFTADIGVTDWRDFGWERKEPPIVSFYVGTPGSQRKLVMMLADPSDGTPQRVVKFPLAEGAWLPIVNEYNVLQELRADGRCIGPAPVLIHSDRRYAVQSWIEGRPDNVGIGPAHLSFLASLAQPGRTIPLERCRAELLETRARLREQGVLSPEAASEVECLLKNSDWRGEVPAVRIHGDFTPWNLKRRKDGSVCAVDWEDSEAEGLPFYDLSFFDLQVSRLLGRKVEIGWAVYEAALSGMTAWGWTPSRVVRNAAWAAARMAIIGAAQRENSNAWHRVLPV